MDGRIYLLGSEGEITPMEETKYEAEELLQALLAEYPDLMAGDQMNPSNPRKWLLVRREIGIPDVEGGAGRWSMDHLFIDQDGIPTLVEVKRSTDTRARREVVAQMLDYAANAVAYWPIEQLQANHEVTCSRLGVSTDEHLVAALGVGVGSEEDFWQLVKINLRAGRIRMVFVADAIAPELLRIVEFLNEQMDPAEVLAVEVRQFLGEGNRTLVPRVVGQTIEAQDRKRTRGQKRKWSREAFVSDLTGRRTPEEVRIAQLISGWVEENEMTVDWGEGRVIGTFHVRFPDETAPIPSFSVQSDGRVGMAFGNLAETEAFKTEAKRTEIRKRLQTIGIEFDIDKIGKWPTTTLSVLANEKVRTEFLEIWEWVASEVRAARR